MPGDMPRGMPGEGLLARRDWRGGLAGLVLGLAFASGLLPARADAPCETLDHRGGSYIVCTLDVTRADLRLFLDDAQGRPHGAFSSVRDTLSTQGLDLAFAVNGGMYHRDRSPVGLAIEDGVERAPISTRDGPGNFHLLPNGVFAWGPEGAVVRESRAFAADPGDWAYATQSGPMLVIEGALHPRFLKDGTSRKIRNGVGVKADGHTVVFAISRARVNFHEFGTLFRDRLDTPDALFLDGTISSLYAPALGRADGFWPMGPIIGAVVPR